MSAKNNNDICKRVSVFKVLFGLNPIDPDSRQSFKRLIEIIDLIKQIGGGVHAVNPASRNKSIEYLINDLTPLVERFNCLIVEGKQNQHLSICKDARKFIFYFKIESQNKISLSNFQDICDNILKAIGEHHTFDVEIDPKDFVFKNEPLKMKSLDMGQLTPDDFDFELGFDGL